MRSIMSMLLFAIIATDALGETRMPNEYTADWVGEVPGGNVHEIFYVSGKNTRWQNAPGDAATLIMISNAQENVTYQVDVPNKVYEEVPYQPKIIDDSRMRYAHKNEKAKSARIELVGTETIDGMDCDIYRETSLVSYRYENTYWVSKAYGVPIKIIYRSENLSTKQMQQSKQEWLIKPGHQLPDLFLLPAGYKRKDAVAFASVGNNSLRSQKLIGRPKAIHSALCEDQRLHEIRYVDRHLSPPDCDNIDCQQGGNFDRFEFVENPLIEGMCLIGDDEYFRGKSILQFSDNVFPVDSEQRPQCDIDVKNLLEKAKGLTIKGCWRLGRFKKTGSFNIAEFVEHNGVRTATLSLYDEGRLVLHDWIGKTPTASDPDVWRLGDEGVFHPNENFVLFGLRSGAESELATVGYGGEGINYYLNRTDGNAFVEMLHEYVYTMGY